jgi:hypothetical protein
MQFAHLPSLLVILVASFTAAVGAEDAPLAEELQRLVPHAAGLAQVEVVDIKELDTRPSDGSLFLDVRFRILRGTGTTAEGVKIVKEQGGHPAPNSAPFKPRGPVKLDTFKQGERYWVAFCSQYDWERCPQGVVATWPEQARAAVLEEAIRTDYYVHRPQYDPRSGLTHSYRAAEDKKTWQVRMEWDGKLLWDVSLPGEKFKGEMFDGEWCLMHRDHWSSGLGHADKNRSGWFLLAETTNHLETKNTFQLPAEEHRLTYALEADSGKTAIIWVSIMRLGPTSTPSVVQYFDMKTGKVRREERHDLFHSGGLAVGASEERWYRKLVRTYDANTSELKGEEVLRHANSPEGSKFVPVKK